MRRKIAGDGGGHFDLPARGTVTRNMRRKIAGDGGPPWDLPACAAL
jgi:hypothetical protein